MAWARFSRDRAEDDHSPPQPRVPRRPPRRPRAVRGRQKALAEAREAPDLRLAAGRDALPRLGHDGRLRYEAQEGEKPASEPGRDDDELLRRGDALGHVALVRRGFPRAGRRVLGPARLHLRGARLRRSGARRTAAAQGPGPLQRKAWPSIRGRASSIRPRIRPTGSSIASSRRRRDGSPRAGGSRAWPASPASKRTVGERGRSRQGRSSKRLGSTSTSPTPTRTSCGCAAGRTGQPCRQR